MEEVPKNHEIDSEAGANEGSLTGEIGAFDAEQAKKNVKMERLRLRSEALEKNLKKITGYSQEEEQERLRLETDFLRQQGDDLIEDPQLQQEWNTDVITPEKDSWPLAEPAVWFAMEVMTALADGADMPYVEFLLTGINMQRPYVALTACRLVARFSERGKEFAEYARINDLDEKDPRGYWRVVKNPDGSFRSPFENAVSVEARMTPDTPPAPEPEPEEPTPTPEPILTPGLEPEEPTPTPEPEPILTPGLEPEEPTPNSGMDEYNYLDAEEARNRAEEDAAEEARRRAEEEARRMAEEDTRRMAERRR